MAAPGVDKVSVEHARALVEATTFDIFNERNQSKRRQLMERYWAADLTCHSPFGASKGYDAMDQVWDGLHADEKSTWVFQRSGELWLNFNIIMQAWVYGRAGEEPGMKGWDVMIVNDEGKVKELCAMIDGVSTHAGNV